MSYNQIFTTMEVEKEFRAARLEHRNALIREVFYQLTNHPYLQFDVKRTLKVKR